MTADLPGAGGRPVTVVAFHAHPDDEALLSAGTLATLAAQGHRVLLVFATRGEAGLADAEHRQRLGERREAEAQESAAAIGAQGVEFLGYADSGWDEPTGHPDSFADADVERAAARLAVLLLREDAHVLTSYDAAGGYGHPDHVQVHRVAARAAEIAQVPVVLEATLDRTLLQRLLAVAHALLRMPMLDPRGFDHAYSSRRDLTHRVDVRRQWRAKRASLAAHASQATTDRDGDQRTLRLLLRLPGPLFRVVFRYEWFSEAGHRRGPGERLRDDPLSGLRHR